MLLTFSAHVIERRSESLWMLVYHGIPGAQAIRATTRIYMIVYPLLLLGGLLALQRLIEWRQVSPRGEGVLLAALLLLACAENYFPQRDDKGRSFAYAEFYARAHRNGEKLRGADAAFGILDEKRRPFYERSIEMMWAGLYANVPVINGFSGRVPTGYQFEKASPTFEEIRDDGKDGILFTSWLGRDWQGRLVIVDIDDEPRSYVMEVK
jgi:hypothetical protein